MSNRKKTANPLANVQPLKKSSSLPTADDANTTKTGYSNPLASLTRESVNKAVRKTSQAGSYKKRTFLIPPDMDDIINKICEETGIKRMELGRWLLATGIKAYQDGQGPQIEEVVSVKVKIPGYSGD